MIEEQPGATKLAPVESTAATVLAKYGAIWVWTVLVSLSGGLSYNYMGSFGELIQMQMMGMRGLGGPGMNGGGGDWVPMVMTGSSVVGVLASVASWICLYLFFVIYVVPVAIHGSSPVADDRRRQGGTMFLKRTYQFLIVAAIARVTPTLVMIFASLMNKG